MHNSSLGIDEREIEENYERQQISKITTLIKNSNDFNEISSVILDLSKKVISRLNKENLFFKTISVILVSTELKTHSKSKTLENYSNSEKELSSVARVLLREFLEKNPKTIIRRFGVRVANFGEKQNQKTLLEY